MPKNTKSLSSKQIEALLATLKTRFEKNMKRHSGLTWSKVAARLTSKSDKLWSLHEMENTGGEPDVIGYNKKTGELIFADCSAESPAGRRSLCYDREALLERKEHKPRSSAMEMGTSMGIELLNEQQYWELQQLGNFDSKTSSWLQTPAAIRKQGGAIFGDYRYGQVFIYHNGAQSYYAARGFRGLLRV